VVSACKPLSVNVSDEVVVTAEYGPPLVVPRSTR
jgi:hypothetical protein